MPDEHASAAGSSPVASVAGPDDPLFDALAALFDQYRVHYGQAPSSARSTAWLQEHWGPGSLTGFLARPDELDVSDVASAATPPAGFALAGRTPASLRLGHAWVLRDLYVRPGQRRRGMGSALVLAVRRAASADRALRLSLQTEADNEAALDLYRRLGFEPVTGYTALSLAL